jgi:hypothetical protein
MPLFSGQSFGGQWRKWLIFVNPVTNVVATDVGTNQAWYSGSASVSFTPATTGIPATSFNVTGTSGNSSFTATGTSSPITVTGMPSQISPYTFSVVAVNQFGLSQPSIASSPINVTTVPSTVQNIFATAGGAGSGSATVTFIAPVDNGGKAITLYTATSTPGGLTGTATTAGSITVSGLTANVSYTFSITATNANGTGAASIASNSISVAPAPIIATPAQQDTFTGFSPSTIYPGTSVTLQGSFPAPLTNITVNGVNQSFSGTTFTAPSTPGSYSVQPYDGQAPVMNALTMTVSAAPVIINTPRFGIIINTPRFGIIINTPRFIATPAPAPVIIATPRFGGCWAVGSMVTLANGSKVAIEKLKIGDEVLTADIPTYPNGEDSSKWYPTSVWSTDRVDTITQRTTKVVYNSQYTEPYYYLINGSYKLTWEHWMFIERDGLWQFQQMANLKVGDKLVDQSNTPVDIFKIEIKQEPIEVSMLDVEPNDLFYAEGILTHNYTPPVKT